MKKVVFSFAVLTLIFATSCGGDDENDDLCQTCAAFEITVEGETQSQAAQEVCLGDNGNAFVDDFDSGLPFESYIQAAELLTDCN